MKKLLAIAISALFVSSAANAFSPDTLIMKSAQGKSNWYSYDAVAYPDPDGKVGPRYKLPYGVFEFGYNPVTYVDAGFEGDGSIYPLLICGTGMLKRVGAEEEPANLCFGKDRDNKLETIELMDDEFMTRYYNDEYPLGLVRGRHFVNENTKLWFKDVCDPYNGRKGNTCPTIRNLPGYNKLNK